jgi:hypothetical protein
MVERSTLGAAGLSRETASISKVKPTTATPAHIASRRILFFLKSGRAISITPCCCTRCAKGARLVHAENKHVGEIWRAG